jgi:hypothetical protein
MVELEDKKFLVEWMGGYVWENGKGFNIVEYLHTWPPIFFNKWNPDTCHKDFTEVWIKMTMEQQQNVIRLSVGEPLNVATHCWWTTKLLVHPEQVMEKVLEVLKGGEA